MAVWGEEFGPGQKIGNLANFVTRSCLYIFIEVVNV